MRRPAASAIPVRAASRRGRRTGVARGRGEMADAAGLGPVGGNTVGVQSPRPHGFSRYAGAPLGQQGDQRCPSALISVLLPSLPLLLRCSHPRRWHRPGYPIDRPGHWKTAQGRPAAYLGLLPGYRVLDSENSGGKLEYGALSTFRPWRLQFWSLTARSAASVIPPTPTRRLRPSRPRRRAGDLPAVRLPVGEHLRGRDALRPIRAKYKSCRTATAKDGSGGTLKETVHSRAAERVGGHKSMHAHRIPDGFESPRCAPGDRGAVDPQRHGYLHDPQPVPERPFAQAHPILAHAQADARDPRAEVRRPPSPRSPPAQPAQPARTGRWPPSCPPRADAGARAVARVRKTPPPLAARRHRPPRRRTPPPGGGGQPGHSGTTHTQWCVQER